MAKPHDVSEKISPPVTKYYLKIAKKYRILQIILIVVLIFYVLFIYSTFGEHLTEDNLQYLFRDFDSLTQGNDRDFTQIRYERQSEQAFAVFKNGLAMAGKESVELYDATGLLQYSERIGYTDPTPVPSEKYLLLYDMGGTGYSVYNSLAKIISREADHKIVDGDMSNTGAFILVTRSNDTKYVVQHYSSLLSRTMSIYKDNYVMDAAISRNGKQIVVCSAIPSDTDFDCEIALYTEGVSDTTALTVIPGTMPLSVVFGEDGFTVLCDNGLYFFDKNGEERVRHLISGMTLEYADLTCELTVLAAGENALGSTNRIMVCDADGSLLLNGTLEERVMGVTAPSEKDRKSSKALAYIMTPKSVLRLTPEEKSKNTDGTYEAFLVEESDVGVQDVLAIRAVSRGILVCSPTGAYNLFR